jgi:ABC-type phosphate transport system substrate-binding protein
MNRRTTIAALAAITTLALAACGGSGDSTSSSAAQQPDTSTNSDSSDNGSIVDRVTAALDKLDVEWDSLTGPTYNAAANSDVRNLNIGGYSAGIHEFRTEESAKAWSDTSDTLGGIHVAFANSAVSLNSEDGREASEKLAPRLAEELGGEAHVADDPMAALDDLASELDVPSDGPQPTPAAAPVGTNPVPGFSCGDWKLYQAGTAIYTDGSTGYEESCYQPMMDAATAGGTGSYPEEEVDPTVLYNECIESFGGPDGQEDGFDVTGFCSANLR